MVKAIVKIDDRTNRVLNILKAKYGLTDKSQALNLMAQQFEESVLEPELRPEFVKSIQETMKGGKFVKVKDFAKEFGIKKKK
ncbi:MAG: DUF2683 family protein [Candidatus Aenigmatarchaeota archaeon]